MEKLYKIKVGKEDLSFEYPKVNGRQILTLAKKLPPENFWLTQKVHGRKVEVGLEDVVDLSQPGVEMFTAIPKDATEGNKPEDHLVGRIVEDMVVDLEEYAKEGKIPPPGKKYRIKINKTHFIVDVSVMTGREIIGLAFKNPAEGYQLNQKIHGEKKVIGYDEKVDFTNPGIEKFTIIPKDATEGDFQEQSEGKAEQVTTKRNLRRQFDLPSEDVEFLNSIGLEWETVKEGPHNWLIIYGYSIPNGYNVSFADVALRIDAGYSRSQIDMAYFNPSLSRKDGKPINNLSNMNLDGKAWQQWSRHRTAANPWQPGNDNIGTHLDFFEYNLKAEFSKR